MTQERGQDIHTAPTDSVVMPAGSDLADGSPSALFGKASAAGLDLGSGILPERLAYKWIQTTLSGAVAGAFLYAHWSPDDTTYADIDNGILIGVMDCQASTDVELTGSFEVLMRYFKLSIRNESGGSLDFTSSNAAIAIKEVFGDNL